MKLHNPLSTPITITVIIGFILLGNFFYYFFLLQQNEVSEKINNQEIITKVVILHDGPTLLHTNVFFFYPPANNILKISIPNRYGNILRSINRVDRYSSLYNQGKKTEYIKELEKILSTKLPSIMEVEKKDFIKSIDLIDGLPFENLVDINSYENGRYYKIPAGKTLLDSYKTRQILDYLDTIDNDTIDDDLYDNLLTSYLLQIWEKRDLILQPKVLPLLKKYVDFSLSDKALSTLLTSYTLPISIKERILTGTSRNIDQTEIVFPFTGDILNQNIFAEILQNLKIDIQLPDNISQTIGVYNGTSIRGLAARTANLLSSFGFSVETIANADNFDYQKTIVVANLDDVNLFCDTTTPTDDNYLFCQILTILDTDLVYESTSSPLYVNDINIILGTDRETQ